MPVIGCADEDNIQVFFGQHCPIVFIKSRAFAGLLPLAHLIGRILEEVAIYITKGDDLYGSDLQEAKQIAFAVPARTDEADFGGSGGEDEIEAAGAERGEREGGSRGFEEAAAIDIEVRHRKIIFGVLRRFLPLIHGEFPSDVQQFLVVVISGFALIIENEGRSVFGAKGFPSGHRGVIGIAKASEIDPGLAHFIG